ncbi:DNA-binding transcriptional regulator, MarR family [Arthrobacter subterraneus]|uniref:DNA-binding transcriptional regulator, MarR family n=1 Tax=Arthrobacter subterraneus TaxID=335973 RepID=A0A1G8FI34_9MICC|nr:MarR family transcriptional regulator [Arthrobacter subterraneus]SDH81827.1 DNA-binding transcriptional regulator, MarR family [Arthrobacter subterraneus]
MDTSHWSTSRLLSTAARLNENRDNERLRSIGVTHSGLTILKVLSTVGSMSQVRLAQTVRVQAQTVGKALERLEVRSLVRRTKSASDRRVTFVELTPSGRAILDQVQQSEGVALGGTGYAEEDLRAALISVIEATRNNLLADGAEPGPELAVSA